ncbi:hypothetical protein F4553_005964 [Allocatelliglobosispora scoriae]|uniref:Cardiolipin synthase N-terminal domain-containing protein n=1 Tax=Allocatelliglobosispora scoriae TaxID=643052 RepID=A0A841C0P4_9ACTN|nr:PLD nuclease N-terminal domain-containing protein [Allocatelliglobosispora scoriae]MBB5872530.1 hypothetical protein [Allocatelliglobosispora scoriae]
MIRVWFLLFLLDLVLTIAALIVCSTTEDEEFAVFPKLIWMLAIVFLPLLGPILWFAYGRQPRIRRRPGPGRAPQSAPRQLAPDDDPAFLQSIADRQRESTEADRELMRKWEADLRRREEELRKQSPTDE